MGKSLFLHVGTHKTGTTSLQIILTSKETELAERGVYIPRAGRSSMFSGHHNVAWQLNDDARFDPSLGDVRALQEEIAGAGQSTVILSSEDFEYLYCRPDRMNVLKSLADSLGYDAYVMVFFREWASYANSLYAELIRYGLTQSVEDFVDSIIQHGEYDERLGIVDEIVRTGIEVDDLI